MWNSLRTILKRAPKQPPSLPDPSRALPDFIIIGAQKCGTSSLYEYLSAHPYVRAASTKEVHYFDWKFSRGVRWYQSYFPLKVELERCSPDSGARLLTGEASPYYIFHARVPQRVKELLPQVKLIVLLRNPVHRALSHYHHEFTGGFEHLSFPEALDQEEARLQGERGMQRYDGEAHIHHSYLSRGIYADQLVAWYRIFPSNQILVVKAEDLYARPELTFRRVTEFLELPEAKTQRFEVFNAGSYDSMDPSLSRRLHRYFEPHNARLYRLLGRDLGWERDAPPGTWK